MVNTLSSMARLIMVLPNSNTLNNLLCSMLLNPLLCLLRTIIPTTLRKHTVSSHSMARNNLNNHSKHLNLPLDTVCPPISSRSMVDPHSSGKVLLKLDHLSIIHGVVVAFLMLEAVMKHLSWALQFVWVLIMIEAVVTWLKRAVAIPSSFRTIKLHLLPLLSLHIKVILQYLSMADNVHHLILIPTTLALIGVGEETRISEAEVVVVISTIIIRFAVATILVSTVMAARDLLLKTSTSLQVQNQVARRRRSAAQTLSV
jgi:hypothetical protein